MTSTQRPLRVYKFVEEGEWKGLKEMRDKMEED